MMHRQNWSKIYHVITSGLMRLNSLAFKILHSARTLYIVTYAVHSTLTQTQTHACIWYSYSRHTCCQYRTYALHMPNMNYNDAAFWAQSCFKAIQMILASHLHKRYSILNQQRRNGGQNCKHQWKNSIWSGVRLKSR